LLSKPRRAAFVATSATAALALTMIGSAVPAQAVDTYSYTNWAQLSNTIDLRAAMDKSDAYTATMTGMHLNLHAVESGTTVGGSTTEDVSIDSTKTKSAAGYQIVDNETHDLTQYRYFFADGTYIESLKSYEAAAGFDASINAALARLGRPNATAVNDHSSATLIGLPSINPATIFKTLDRDPLSTIAGPTNYVVYTAVTKAPDATVATSTVYSWGGYFYASSQGTQVKVDLLASETFNADGFITGQSFEEHAAGGLYDLVVSGTQSDKPNLIVNTPDPALTVDAYALDLAGYQLDAEKSLTPKANSIVAKAKAIAKAAKKRSPRNTWLVPRRH